MEVREQLGLHKQAIEYKRVMEKSPSEMPRKKLTLPNQIE